MIFFFSPTNGKEAMIFFHRPMRKKLHIILAFSPTNENDYIDIVFLPTNMEKNSHCAVQGKSRPRRALQNNLFNSHSVSVGQYVEGDHI